MISIFKTPWKLFVTVIFLAGVISGISQSNHLIAALDQLRGSFELSPPQNLTAASDDLKLLTEGDLTQSDEISRWRSVHESSPKSAMHFARYIQKAQVIPGDYAETVADLAPFNGWFDIWEISQKTSDSFERIYVKDHQNKSSDTPTRYKILEPATLKQAIETYHRAAEKEDFTNYFIEMLGLIIETLETPQTWLEEIEYRTKILQIEFPVSTRQYLTDFTGAAFQSLIEANDREGFLKFGESSRKLAPKLLKDTHDSLGALTAMTWIRTFYQQMLAGGEHFKLPELTREYEALWTRYNERGRKMEEQRDSAVSKENDYMLKLHGSIMARLTTPSNFTSGPMPLTRENLQSSCRAENAVVSRLFTISWLVLFIAMALDTWIVTLRSPTAHRNEIKIGLNELCLSSRWKILIIGVILPFLVLLAVRYFTPLGQLDFAAYSSKFTHLAIPLISFGLVITISIIMTARHLNGPQDQFQLKKIIPILLPLSAILIIGCYYASGRNSSLVPITSVLNIGTIGWLGFIAFRFHCKKDPSKYLKAQLITPAFFLAAGLFGLWTWVLKHEEHYWIARDEFITPQTHFMSKFEATMVHNFIVELESLLQ